MTRINKLKQIIFPVLIFLFIPGVLLPGVGSATTSNTATGDDSMQIMKEFSQEGRDAKSEIVQIPDQRKRLIMFIMGIPLLIFITTTVCLGVAMVVYGKQVFVAHMIFAGLSLTLALGHAVVGVVWFNPF